MKPMVNAPEDITRLTSSSAFAKSRAEERITPSALKKTRKFCGGSTFFRAIRRIVAKRSPPKIFKFIFFWRSSFSKKRIRPRKKPNKNSEKVM